MLTAQPHRDEWHNQPMGRLLLQCPESTNPQPAGGSGGLHTSRALPQNMTMGVSGRVILGHAMQMILSVSANDA